MGTAMLSNSRLTGHNAHFVLLDFRFFHGYFSTVLLLIHNIPFLLYDANAKAAELQKETG